jgi:hypothetical protein
MTRRVSTDGTARKRLQISSCGNRVLRVKKTDCHSFRVSCKSKEWALASGLFQLAHPGIVISGMATCSSAAKRSGWKGIRQTAELPLASDVRQSQPGRNTTAPWLRSSRIRALGTLSVGVPGRLGFGLFQRSSLGARRRHQRPVILYRKRKGLVLAAYRELFAIRFIGASRGVVQRGEGGLSARLQLDLECAAGICVRSLKVGGPRKRSSLTSSISPRDIRVLRLLSIEPSSVQVLELTESVYTSVHKGIPNEESPRTFSVPRGTWVLL